MKIIISTYRLADSPELVEALAPDGAHAAIVDPEPTLDSHLLAAEKVMLKLGYRRRDYVLVEGIAATQRHWAFTLGLADEFTRPPTR